MRISKFIAHAGYCSRREAEKLIKENKVTINNEKCNDFSYRVSENDKVYVENTHIINQSEIEVYILNKPKGYITSKKDELNRKTVYDLIPKNKSNLISIGRLDFNTEGLLLFTNNGDYARHYELPKNKINRTYKVKVYGNFKNSYLEIIKKGIEINGIKHNINGINLTKKLKTNNWFTINLSEGKNREIRKIFEHFDLVVNRIIRTHYGSYSIDKIKSGEFKKIATKKI